MYAIDHRFVVIHLEARHITADPVFHTQIYRLCQIFVIPVEGADDSDVLEDEVVESKGESGRLGDEDEEAVSPSDVHGVTLSFCSIGA